ncbi:hypothetical protein D9M69_548480 [compost metagenome]
MAGNGSLRDGIDRAFVGAGIIFRNHHDQARDKETNQATDKEIGACNRHSCNSADFTPANCQRVGNCEAHNGQKSGCNETFVKRTHN